MAFQRIIKSFLHRRTTDLNEFKALFERFQQILTGNNRVFDIISELEDKLSGDYIFDINYLKATTDELSEEVLLTVSNLNIITDNRYPELFSLQVSIHEELKNIVEGKKLRAAEKYTIDYDAIDSDNAEIVGGKNSNLNEIRNLLKLCVPNGFVITTAAYRQFMEYNQLWPQIRSLYRDYGGGDKSGAEQYDHAIDDLFRGARVPPDVRKAVARKLKHFRQEQRGGAGLAVRSSAYGEDVEGRSYAGQFKSFLNCSEEEIIPTYVKVIASRFKHTVAVYNEEDMLDDTVLPMAVGVQQMVPAVVAGVIYSVDPSGLNPDSITISASYGLGSAVVEGTVNSDYFRISRLDPTRITERRIGTKRTQLLPTGPRGVGSQPVSGDLQQRPCLGDEQVIDLANTALVLDRYFKRPVDVEWCLDEKNTLCILQCRPLKMSSTPRVRAVGLQEILADKPVIMRKKGIVAQRGIAAGRVWQVEEDDDPAEFPVGAIAVSRYTSPRLTSIIRRAGAIITDTGSSTGHMATVAREFGVPMIVNTAEATQILPDGEKVTVDAGSNVVYRGIVHELLEYAMEAQDVYRDLREYRILRRLLRRVSPLYLMDPTSADFTAERCRTYHDIIRFSHEKAVQCLIELNISSRRFRGIESKSLKLPVPLGLSVIDLGGGLSPDTPDTVTDPLEKVQSPPLHAILEGLTTPGAWSTQPAQLKIGDLFSSMTRYSLSDKAGKYRDQNLAVISGHYANMSLRLGYHFNVIDTYVSDNVNDNYIYFRFVGGVTGTRRRHLRAVLIKEILEKLKFKVTVSGDLVVARLKKTDADEMLRVLREIGKLIGFTRQLDTQMHSEASIQKCFQAFFGENEDRP